MQSNCQTILRLMFSWFVLCVQDAQDLLALTGVPVTEDELLYAIPVSAPYSCLLNFK